MNATTQETDDGSEDSASDSDLPAPRPYERQSATRRPQQRTDVRRRMMALRRW